MHEPQQRIAGRIAVHDALDTRAYIKNVIPFWRPRRRNAARALVANMPELADCAMVVALIPEALALPRRRRQCWELYGFVLGNWLKREKKRIAPAALTDAAMALAVQLLLREPDHSVAISALDAWEPGPRSLLIRDDAGNYRFIHESIRDFLFIKAFIQGDARCATMGWTDMMCRLFLDWGRAHHDAASTAWAGQLLELDLGPTKLFPLRRAPAPAVVIDADSVQRAFAHDASSVAACSIPFAWHYHTSRHRNDNDLVRVYDFAQGKTWQWVNTSTFGSHADRLLYYTDRYEKKWADIDPSGKIWTLPTLSELRCLLDILTSHGLMESYLDDQALYWIDDADNSAVCAARIRAGSRSHAQTHTPPGWQHVCTVAAEPQRGYILDVYKIATRAMAVSKAKALPLHTCRDDAAGIWRADEAASRNQQAQRWAVRRISPLPESSWLDVAV